MFGTHGATTRDYVSAESRKNPLPFALHARKKMFAPKINSAIEGRAQRRAAGPAWHEANALDQQAYHLCSASPPPPPPADIIADVEKEIGDATEPSKVRK